MNDAAHMSILCAVDFSAASALALKAAGRIAATFDRPLTVTTVGDPLLAAAEQVASGDDPAALLTRALAEFVDETLGPGSSARHQLTVPLGDAAAEILRQAEGLGASLLVLSTQGASGVRKFMFGSVAERVLREATRLCGSLARRGQATLARTDGNAAALADAITRFVLGRQVPRT